MMFERCGFRISRLVKGKREISVGKTPVRGKRLGKRGIVRICWNMLERYLEYCGDGGGEVESGCSTRLISNGNEAESFDFTGYEE